MKTKITFLSLMLLFTVIGSAQQVNPVYKNRQLNEENNLPFDTKFEQFGINNPFLYGHHTPSVGLRTATNNMQKLDSLIGYHWDENTSQFSNSVKREFTYDTNGNVTIEILKLWNINSNQWNYYFKVIYTYDANNNLIGDVLYNWNTNTNQWNNLKKMLINA